ncbi:ABC transporter substrate-binding protein [Xylophilus sp. GOD-11R]|uniref:ABC transporter substrate-binding protein n=1 Tax=Xylophilus sp. GOD-11R TaxID=3089814 RepID=UPI00298D19F4|nr:ABC transporter substrate-binding protein [Xylophilus sp. GOD-11R]WPB56301.1 ABC transporter substrate-binding protein [Xylophilus sp. GOD-11R]
MKSLLASCVLLAASFSATAATKVVYGNVTEMTLSQAPMVAAKQLGYFAEEGLDVELLGFKGTGTLIPQMLAKRVDIGYPNPDTLILSQAPGQEKLPIKFFYNATRSSGWEFAVLADSPIKSIKELDGKTVGVGAMTFGNVPITKAQFKDLKVNATMVPVGIGSAAFLALTSKRIDALNLFDAQHATLEAQGTQIRRLPQAPQYAALFSNGFVAHEDMIRDKPQVLVGFGRAVAKATVFCEINREACVKLFWKEYPNAKPAGDEAKVLADGVKVFSARFDKMLDFPAGQARQWGYFPPKTWTDFAKALNAGGQLATADVNVQNCYTNAFVAQMSTFDTAKIIAAAKAFKD